MEKESSLSRGVSAYLLLCVMSHTGQVRVEAGRSGGLGAQAQLTRAHPLTVNVLSLSGLKLLLLITKMIIYIMSNYIRDELNLFLC